MAILPPKIARTFSRSSSDIGPLLEKDTLQALYNFWITGMVWAMGFSDQFDQSENDAV